MTDQLQVREFHPELLSRRGELIAWVLTAVLFAAWIFLTVGGYYIFWGLPLLAVLLLLAALGISLGNWMDRRSWIQIADDEINLTNGVRHTKLKWEQIVRVEVYPAKWGDKVRVLGENAHFDFRTLGEVEVGGEVKGKMGYPQGDQILKTILENARLKEIEHTDEGYYYARE